MTIEYCYNCDQPTGNAGELDGSLMVEGKPYCDGCHNAYRNGMEAAAKIADGLYDSSNTVWSARNAANAIREEIK